jgi:hypothetical protein
MSRKEAEKKNHSIEGQRYGAFLDEVYDLSVTTLTTEGMQKSAEFPTIHLLGEKMGSVSYYFDPGSRTKQPIVTLDVLTKGVVLQEENRTVALALGYREVKPRQGKLLVASFFGTLPAAFTLTDFLRFCSPYRSIKTNDCQGQISYWWGDKSLTPDIPDDSATRETRSLEKKVFQNSASFGLEREEELLLDTVGLIMTVTEASPKIKRVIRTLPTNPYF